MAPVDNDDSGMESQEGSMGGGSAKEEEEAPPEPPKPPQQSQPEIESSYDDEVSWTVAMFVQKSRYITSLFFWVISRTKP